MDDCTHNLLYLRENNPEAALRFLQAVDGTLEKLALRQDWLRQRPWTLDFSPPRLQTLDRSSTVRNH
jgi:hypothetical protein